MSESFTLKIDKKKKEKTSLRPFYISGTDSCVKTLFEKTGKFKEVPTQEEAEFVIWTGGGDINPAIYGQNSIEKSPHYNKERDTRETNEWERRTGKQKFIGICRGFQMLNIVNGGSLYQDCNNHNTSSHKVTYFDPRQGGTSTWIVNSIHHQMIIPSHHTTVVARAEEATYVKNHKGIKQPIPIEELDPEIAWFPAGFGVQFHPEWCEQSAELFWRSMNDWHLTQYGDRLV